QQDRLFQGSIADNICCFDSSPDIARIREVACIAEIWNHLATLPMTVHTPISATGAGLSGGQVQRLLLARAIYRRPRILFLDEATSHLDVDTEAKVLQNLRELGITMISIAHRQAVIEQATRIIRLV
ncbi:MAG: ATP-binding cassette domain-containing protein, partial [Proteobacteria bacterium]|nr:ATP-binding cassette domain-containing protein [Pseudomonadota bacterium]